MIGKELDPEWLPGALATHKFHTGKVRENVRWTYQDSAKALNRAVGPICEEVNVINWMRTHSRELRDCEYIKDALEFIKQKKRQMKSEGFTP